MNNATQPHFEYITKWPKQYRLFNADKNYGIRSIVSILNSQGLNTTTREIQVLNNLKNNEILKKGYPYVLPVAHKTQMFVQVTGKDPWWKRNLFLLVIGGGVLLTINALTDKRGY